MPEPRAAVIGSGVMGAGIAHVLAAGGSEVTLYDPDPAALDRALASIRSAARSLGRDVESLIGRLTTTVELDEAVGPAMLVVEAGPEIPKLKQELFSEMERLTSSDAVLASNTSAIPIRTIAELVDSPQRVLGTHFWHPPHLVPLVEVVQSDQTDVRYVDWTIELLARRGMRPVHVRADVPGFVGNRLQHALKREAIALVHAGVCDVDTLDTVVKQGFGARLGVLGPLEQADLGGLDLTYQIHQVVMPALDNTPEPHPMLVEKVEHGELGAKTGRGFRSWDQGEAEARRSEVNRALLDQARRRLTLAQAQGPTITSHQQAERRFGLDGVLTFLTGADPGSASDTPIEWRLRRGSNLPMHRHELAGEVLSVLDGELSLDLDGRTVMLAAGDTARLPAGTTYGWRVASEYARVLIVAEPGRTNFYRDLSKPPSAATEVTSPVQSTDPALTDAALKNGVELLAHSVQGA
jgi:3-hydroxybutyryl-CoA dehydrogenase